MKYVNFIIRVLVSQPFLAISSVLVGIVCILWCLIDYKHDTWLSIPVVHKGAWAWAKEVL